MTTLVGRDDELARIGDALASARAARVATALKVTGDPGAGKTALFHRIAEDAAAANWLASAVDCHRIQSGLPFVTARRIAQSFVDQLGDQRERYAGGLDEALKDAASVGEALLRLTEGLLLDFSVLVAIDDAQWMDAESRELLDQLMRSFSDRPLALALIERSDEPGPLDVPAVTHNIALQRLTPQAAAELVKIYYPDAAADVVSAIVAHTSGLALDIVSVSQAAQQIGARDASAIEASVRTVVARQLSSVDAGLREFLQLCALIPEPIEYRILTHLWPEEQNLVKFIEQSSGRYLVQDGNMLRFVHSLVADSVRQTMPIEIPYRRRILGVLTAKERLTLEDLERIIQQASACGDFETARAYLLKLAAQSARESALFTAANAFERALEIASPQQSELVRFYADYASVLTMQGRMGEVRSLVERGLDEAASAGMSKGAGTLAATLLIALSALKNHTAALEAYGRLRERFTAAEDRLQLCSVALWLYTCASDQDGFERTKAELNAIEVGSQPAEIAMRIANAEAHLRLRQGDVSSAISLVEEAISRASFVPSANRRSAEVSRTLLTFLAFGLGDTEEHRLIRPSPDATQTPILQYIKSLAALAQGKLEDANEIVRETLSRRIDRQGRHWLLSVAAATAALSSDPSFQHDAIKDGLRGFMQGEVEESMLPTAAWHAAAMSTREPTETKSYINRIVGALRRPLNPETLFFPLALSLAAARLKDRVLLEQFATFAHGSKDRSPWHVAQWNLATGYALETLKRGSGRPFLLQARAEFRTMKSELFEAFAGAFLDPNDAPALQFLTTAGVRDIPGLKNNTEQGNARASRGSRAPSRRELEIIALIAEGSTNREIAERLFLSERTVEAHIANIFAKLAVSKRAQVAAWHVTASTSGSSRTHSLPV